MPAAKGSARTPLGPRFPEARQNMLSVTTTALKAWKYVKKKKEKQAYML
jgi:hypothetical protein